MAMKRLELLIGQLLNKVSLTTVTSEGEGDNFPGVILHKPQILRSQLSRKK